VIDFHSSSLVALCGAFPALEGMEYEKRQRGCKRQLSFPVMDIDGTQTGPHGMGLANLQPTENAELQYLDFKIGTQTGTQRSDGEANKYVFSISYVNKIALLSGAPNYRLLPSETVYGCLMKAQYFGLCDAFLPFIVQRCLPKSSAFVGIWIR
jgi:hypothetical protein